MKVLNEGVKATYVSPWIKVLCLCDNNLMQDVVSIVDIDEDDDDTEEPAKDALPYFNVWDD